MSIHDLTDLPEWNDGDFLFDDEDSESWKPNETREACKALYAKWKEVVFLLKGAFAIIRDNESAEEYIKEEVEMLLSDAYIVGVKIRSSEAGNLYVLRMENASIIRKLAQGIASGLLVLVAENVMDTDYAEILRKEIDQFRTLYINWVNSFEKDEFTDEWGLFI